MGAEAGRGGGVKAINCKHCHGAAPSHLDGCWWVGCHYEHLKQVAESANALRTTGYDGPFMGDEVEPLFNALAALERWEAIEFDE